MAALSSNAPIKYAFGIMRNLERGFATKAGKNLAIGAAVGAAGGFGTSMATGDRHGIRDTLGGAALGAFGGRGFTHFNRENVSMLQGFKNDASWMKAVGKNQYSRGKSYLASKISPEIRQMWEESGSGPKQMGFDFGA